MHIDIQPPLRRGARALTLALLPLALAGCGVLFPWPTTTPTTPTSTPTTTTTTTSSAPAAPFGPLANGAHGWMCAREHGRCELAGEATIYYGDGARLAKKQVRGPVACENRVFGDPAVGVVKSCFVAYRAQVGACRGDGWNAGGWPRGQGMQTVAGCAERCAKTAGCSAFDVARPVGDRYDCYLFGHRDVVGNGGSERCYVRGGGVAPGPTRDPARAAQLNAEGKDLWLRAKDLAGAVVKFREATALDPLPSYFFNLCYASHQLGRFDEARAACEQVAPRGGDEALVRKAQLVLDDIAKRQP
ncbi:MAG: hypothetical protein EP329_22615 [Deltaproteobacteria bacterium]|nr:MAG: hypothetical protein EP329_22615 [Deltaproteobacteria bacterium]